MSEYYVGLKNNTTIGAYRKNDEITRTSEDLHTNVSIPLVMDFKNNRENILEWIDNNKECIYENLLRYGAIVFKNYESDGLPFIELFEQFAKATCEDCLYKENGEHPRQNLAGNIYTPVFYPKYKKLLWHSENSFNYEWPSKIWFGSEQSAAKGGETPVVDNRLVFEHLPKKIRNKFMQLGITYVRNYRQEAGLDWKSVFCAQERADVEKICRNNYMKFEWNEDGILKTFAKRPAAIKHSITQEYCWFNQAQHWHISCLESDIKEYLISLYGKDGLPRNCYYGDGTEIEDEIMMEILNIYRTFESSIPWQDRDILMIDNVLAAHARNPFEGERSLYVAVGDLKKYDGI